MLLCLKGNTGKPPLEIYTKLNGVTSALRGMMT